MFGTEVGLCKLARHALDVALCVKYGAPEHEIAGLPALESVLENCSARSLVVAIWEKSALGPDIESARINCLFGRTNMSLN